MNSLMNGVLISFSRRSGEGWRSGIERERAALQALVQDFSHRSWPPAASVEYSNAGRFLTGGEGVSHAADASIVFQVQRNANGSHSWNTSFEYSL